MTRVYIFVFIFILVLISISYGVFSLRKSIVNDLNVKASEKVVTIQEIKNEVRNKPINSDYVINSLSSGKW